MWTFEWRYHRVNNNVVTNGEWQRSRPMPVKPKGNIHAAQIKAAASAAATWAETCALNDAIVEVRLVYEGE